MRREVFNLCQFPAIVSRHVVTKYESILTPARSCRKQGRNHFHWWSRIVYSGRETC
jgi:alpha-galactosidase/6-phospho-beta-glucosidase family protein